MFGGTAGWFESLREAYEGSSQQARLANNGKGSGSVRLVGRAVSFDGYTEAIRHNADLSRSRANNAKVASYPVVMCFQSI